MNKMRLYDFIRDKVVTYQNIVIEIYDLDDAYYYTNPKYINESSGASSHLSYIDLVENKEKAIITFAFILIGEDIIITGYIERD